MSVNLLSKYPQDIVNIINPMRIKINSKIEEKDYSQSQRKRIITNLNLYKFKISENFA